MQKRTCTQILFCLLFALNAYCEPADIFFCQGKWDGQQEVNWVFESDGKPMTVRLNRNRCQLLADGEPVGWSELMPSLPNPPVSVVLYRNKFRWSLIAGRRIVAFAFVDIPLTMKWFGSGIEDMNAFAPELERILTPFGKWQRVELEDGSVAFRPTEQPMRGVFPVSVEERNLTDIFASLEVQPNGARSIGVGVCWGEEGGYVWRWLRRRGEAVWQLAIATPSNSEWELKPLYEEHATVSPTSWHQLQVFRSGDQIFAGVNGKVLTRVRDNQFGLGKLVLWLETGDLPQPMVKPIRLTRWWCAALSPDIDTFTPFLAQLGKWTQKTNGWMLQADAKKNRAFALLGAADLISWWVVDLKWQNETVGLVFGWLGEKHYNLLRLRPSTETKFAPFPHAVLEIVSVRNGRERVLDEWSVLLEKDRFYRLAIQLTENRVFGFINGMGLVTAEVSPIGKVGVWTNSCAFMRQFWLYKGSEPLVPLITDELGTVQPLSDQPIIAHELVSVTLPAGLPPNVPLSAKLSKEQVTLFVERQGNRLLFRLECQGKFFGTTSTAMPSQLPITVKMERRDKLLIIWLGNQPVWTARIP